MPDVLDRFRARGPLQRLQRIRNQLNRFRIGGGEQRPLPSRVIEAIAREEGPGILARIGDALAVPGDYLRGLLSGEAGERVTPRELLSKLDIEPEAEFDITDPSVEGTLAGLGVLLTDVATDPLTLLAGIGRLGKTAKTVDEAAKAATSARQLARSARGVGAGRRAPSRPITQQLGPVGQRAVQVGQRTRKELLDTILGERRRARELLESLPAGRRPANLFSARGVPQLQRVARRRPTSVPLPRDRELLTLGLPFTRIEGRVPIPRRLERAALAPLVGAGRAARTGLQRAFGRGIPQEVRTVTDVVNRLNVAGAREIGEAIGKREEELLAARVQLTGGSPDDVLDALRKDVRRVREGDKVSVTANEREFAEDLGRIVDGATEAQIAVGARTDHLIENYAERILSPFGRQVLRERRAQNQFRNFMNNRARIRDGSQVRRREYLRDQLTTDVNEFFRNQLGVQGDFFSLDPKFTVETAIRDRGMSAILANLTESLASDFGGLAGRAGDVPLAEFLSRSKIRKFQGATWGTTSTKSVARALRRAGIDPRLTIPKEVANEAYDVLGVLNNTTPEGWRRFLNEFYDPMASLYRAGATTLFPAFHVRNLLGNLQLNFMAGVRDPRHYVEAVKILMDPKRAEKLKTLGVIRGGYSKEMLEELRAAGISSGGNFLQRLASFSAENPVTRFFGKFGDFNENLARVAHYVGKKAQGKSNFAALESVNKYLFDYGKRALAPLERSVANRLFFFWRWNRYALPLMLGQLFEHPRRFAALGRFTTQPGTERPAGIPEFVREAAGIPGKFNPDTGETTFTTKFGSPFEVFGLIDPLDAVGTAGTIKETGREVLSNLIPPIRAIAELIAGEEFFLGQEIEGLDQGSALGTQIGGLVSRLGFEGLGRDIGEEVPTRRPGVTRNRRAPFLRFVTRNLPTQRLTSTLTRLYDAAGESINQARGEPSRQRRRKTLGEEALRSILGINFAQVDTDEEAVNRFRRVLNREAKKKQLQGLAGELEIPFISERGKQDAETRRLFELLNRIRGRRRL